MPPTSKRILIVEDDRVIALAIRELLVSLGHIVVATAETGPQAIDQARELHPELVLMDIVLAGPMDGIEAARRIREVIDVPIVYLTAHADRSTLDRAKATEPFGYILKPFNEDELSTTIEIALYKHAMEAALREREIWLSTVCQSIGDAVIATDTEGRIKLMNPVAEKLTQWSQGEAAGRPITEIFRVINEITRAPVQDPIARVLASGQIVGLANETVLVGRDGLETSVDDSASPVRDPSGRITGVVMVFRDVSDRRRHNRSLLAERERLAVTLRSIGDGVIATDTDAKVVLLNPVAEELTGWKQADAAGRPLTEVFHIINEHTRVLCENPVEKVLAKGTIVGLANHTALVSRDGTERAIADSGAPIRDEHGNVFGAVLVFRDVTLQRKLEDDLIRVQRVEALATMAGAIAHDFNNMLMAILGNLSLVRMRLGQDDATAPFIAEAESACEQARALTRQLATFARGGVPVKKVVSIEGLIRATARFVLRGSPSKSDCQIAPGLWALEADEAQLAQLLTNLLLNADEAMPGGGVIDVRADNVELGANTGVPLPPGRYVRIQIEDHGVGIPPEYVDRVFDPYFTTKKRGSGLGLASVHTIVKRHDGHIEVRSRVSQGTTFTVYLPASERPAGARPARPEPTRGQGRVLVVDDERVVRNALAAIVESLGYEAEAVADGAEAVQLYRDRREAGRRFDAVVLDLVIPGGMGGLDTLRALREMDPEVVAIASSGYSNDAVIADHRKHGFAAAITKPYRPEDLAAALDGALASRKG